MGRDFRWQSRAWLDAAPEVRSVTIAADFDPPGWTAATNAAARWRAEGRVVRIVRPIDYETDFNDLVMGRTARGAA